MICTIEHCDHISRYLCSLCIKYNLHRHNQANLDHIMDLKNLCNRILNMIKQYKSEYHLVEDWKKYFIEYYAHIVMIISIIQMFSIMNTHAK